MAESIEEIRALVVALQDEIRSLTETEDITPEQDARLDVAVVEHETRSADLAKAEDRSRRVDAALALKPESTPGFHVPQVMRHVDPVNVDISKLSDQELRDNAMAVIEKNGRRLEARQLDHIDRTIRTQTQPTNGTQIARRVLVTESPEYRSAFAKGITQERPRWTSDELRALQQYEELRAMSEVSPGSAGGYGVPVLIDPTIILTAGAAGAPVLDICRIETITTNAWKGVSSGAVSWSYDAEGSAVSDDSPTLAQPTVTVYAARGFLPFSRELGEDYPGFAEELQMLLTHGFLDMVASGTVVGDGSSKPRGVFTAIAATAGNQVITTTDGALGAIDFQNLYKSVPERYRAKATWLMHTQVENAVRAFPTSSNYGYFTVDLSKDGIGELQGHPVRTTDYAPQYTGTTLAANIAVLGDFSNFLFVQRAGMDVELVPNLFDVTYNRPTGMRGLFAFARHGYDSINDAGFKILVNT